MRAWNQTLSIVRNNPRKVVSVLVLFYSVGVVGLSAVPLKPFFEILIPWTILMSFTLLILSDREFTWNKIAAAFIIYILSFMLEAIGVNTGLIFGDYVYGESLGLKLFGTPIIIGINWLLLIYCTWELTGRARMNTLLRIVLSSAVMVLYDVVLEPVAIRHDMWSWSGGDIPVQNYIAWFIFSAIAFSLLGGLKISLRNKIAPALLIIQVMFFLLLNIVRWLWAY